jgi:formylglycine-generating enzyme required for sulfatase activity
VPLSLLALSLSACPGPSSSSSSEGSGPSKADALTPASGEVLISAGSFMMGSPKGAGEADERPPYRVELKAFFIDQHEVTNAEYRRFLAANTQGPRGPFHASEPADHDYRPLLPPARSGRLGFPTDYFTNPAYDNHPVVGVDWFSANAYASFHGRRLPSEAEWEYAARSGRSHTYPWGEQSPLGPVAARANYDTPRFPKDRRARRRLEELGGSETLGHHDGFKFTAPVGSFASGKTSSGAFDLAGNVWEWTSSWHVPYDQETPPSPSQEQRRVLRGGAWDSPSSFLLRSSNRVPCDPDTRRNSIGFRTARSAERP